MSLKRLIPVTAIGLLSALAFSGPAAAQEDDSLGAAACVLVPDSVSGQGGGNGVNSVANDVLAGGGWDPLELLDTDPGTFDFDGEAICAGVDAAAEHKALPGSDPDGLLGLGPDVVALTAVTIHAEGSYNNLICGTGTANGTATLSSAEAGGVSIATSFGITFAGGAGPLSIVVDGGKVGNNAISGGNGAGVITITPQSEQGPEVGIPCVIGLSPAPEIPSAGSTADDSQNVTEFLVNGAFVSTLSGEGSDADTPADDSDI